MRTKGEIHSLIMLTYLFCSSPTGFFKGTSADQDRRFSDKELKLLKTMKFPPEFEKKVLFRNAAAREGGTLTRVYSLHRLTCVKST